LDLFPGEVWESMDELEYDSSDADLNGDLSSEDFADLEDYDWGDEEDLDGLNWDEEEVDYSDELEGDGEFFDSNYQSNDGIEFFSSSSDAPEEEGEDEVGAPQEAVEPISRRLRRVVKEEEAGDNRHLGAKESLRDDSIPIFEPILDENEEFDLAQYSEPLYHEEMKLSFDEENEHSGRNLQAACRSNQKRVKIEIRTDNSGHENRWEIRNANGGLLSKGPPGSTKYADNRNYVGGICLNPGGYRVIFFDKFSDGMCGRNTGKGWYRVSIGGTRKFTSPTNCATNWQRRVHSFNIPRPPTNNNNNNGGGAISSRGGCSNVKVQFKIDKYGKETSVTLSGGGRTHLTSIKNVGAFQTKTMTKCLPSGTYTLRLVDQDGICCGHGQGWYKMFVNGVRVIGGGYFIGSKTHTIKIGSSWQGTMTARDREWLNAHNSRRRKYNGGRGYVPLRHSRTLKAAAKNYAERLASNCKNGKLVHAKGINDGENLAKNQGGGTWGRQYAADKIMGRWVENELNWPYPRNAHMTQVVWRATQYVGCGEAVRNVGNNNMCRIQVCRYTRAGNCNVRNGNWRAEAWKDDTGCGRTCPGEGCYI